jgi:hypothetical protein
MAEYALATVECGAGAGHRGLQHRFPVRRHRFASTTPALTRTRSHQGHRRRPCSPAAKPSPSGNSNPANPVITRPLCIDTGRITPAAASRSPTFWKWALATAWPEAAQGVNAVATRARTGVRPNLPPIASRAKITGD